MLGLWKSTKICKTIINSMNPTNGVLHFVPLRERYYILRQMCPAFT